MACRFQAVRHKFSKVAQIKSNGVREKTRQFQIPFLYSVAPTADYQKFMSSPRNDYLELDKSEKFNL